MNIAVSELKLGDYVIGQGFVTSISLCQVKPKRRQVTFSDTDGVTISIKIFEDHDIVTVEELTHI